MQPALPPGIQLTETLEKMQQGTLMRKVKSKSWKKQRYFKLQDDCMTIWYQSKRTGKIESACEYSCGVLSVQVVSRIQNEQQGESMKIPETVLAESTEIQERLCLCQALLIHISLDEWWVGSSVGECGDGWRSEWMDG